jgi:hypothetical protein
MWCTVPASSAEGKKITWRDGGAALYHILQYNVLIRQGSKKTVLHHLVQAPALQRHQIAHVR